MSQPADVAERTLVGNRWVLVGGVGYLLEWVAIIWVGALGIGERSSGEFQPTSCLTRTPAMSTP